MEGHIKSLFSLNKDTSLSEDNLYTNIGLVHFRLGFKKIAAKLDHISKRFVLFHPSEREAQHSKTYSEQRDEGTVISIPVCSSLVNENYQM